MKGRLKFTGAQRPLLHRFLFPHCGTAHLYRCRFLHFNRPLLRTFENGGPASNSTIRANLLEVRGAVAPARASRYQRSWPSPRSLQPPRWEVACCRSAAAATTGWEKAEASRRWLDQPRQTPWPGFWVWARRRSARQPPQTCEHSQLAKQTPVHGDEALKRAYGRLARSWHFLFGSTVPA